MIRTLIASAAALTLAAGFAPAHAAPLAAPAAKPTVVLVHGAFADGSGWAGVYRILKKDGFDVRVVQNPATSIADDVAATKRVIADVKGPVILVGHSYAGVVISEAGVDPKVAGLVFVSAFVPEQGDTIASLSGKPVAPGTPAPPIVPTKDGYLLLDRARFAEAFAADVPAEEAAFLADAQQPWKATSLQERVTDTAWKTKPNWYLVTAQDRMIPPAAQRAMAAQAHATTVEIAASHAGYVSKPAAVAGLIEQAAVGVSN